MSVPPETDAFLRQIEEDLLALGNMARHQNPEVVHLILQLVQYVERVLFEVQAGCLQEDGAQPWWAEWKLRNSSD